MTLNIDLDLGGKSRTITDDNNPRIYYKEWLCAKCGGWIHEDDVEWTLPTDLSGPDLGKPYHLDCLPVDSETWGEI